MDDNNQTIQLLHDDNDWELESLGEGKFGKVFKAKYKNGTIDINGTQVDICVIKKIENDDKSFKTEISVLNKLTENIKEPLNIYMEFEDPKALVVKYYGNGKDNNGNGIY